VTEGISEQVTEGNVQASQDEVMVEWRKIHTEDLLTLNHEIGIRIIKLRKMSWEDDAAGISGVHRFLWGNMKRNSKKSSSIKGDNVKTGLRQVRGGYGPNSYYSGHRLLTGSCVHDNELLGSIKASKISLVAE
jgi:hypothetical protein